MFLIAACPVGNVTNLITKVSRGNVALSIGLSSSAHLMASVLTPLNFALYGNLYAPTRKLMRTIQVDEFEMFLTVLFLIGLPLILGVFVQKQFPNFANRTKFFFNKLSMIFLLLFIIAAFASNAAVLVANLHLVYGFVILHNFVALGGGWSIAKLFRLPEADVRAITIESGIHNSGLGLFLIFQFFDGMGSMALVAACWGVWHLISGWLLAWYWSKN
jgi:BASS family bile acid:Na+ symporter